MDKLTANKKDIIKEAFFSGELSGNDIGLITNKSLPSVIKIIGELTSEGWIAKTGYAVSTGGRRPNTFSLVSGAFYIVAVAMDQYITQIALIDVCNKIVGDVETFELNIKDNANAFEELVHVLDSFVENKGKLKSKILGIGIGMPGFIEANKGVNHSFFKNINGSLSEAIEKVTALPVFIDNDSSLVALAELKFGAAKNKKDAMVINIGWGVGLGLILNGGLYRGHNGFAGEFSHISLFSNNKLCSCGKMGCLETETSLMVIVEKMRQGLTDGRTSVLKDQVINADAGTAFRLIVAAAKNGDQYAIELISKAAYEIGKGVSILIHLLNPELIVLSGRGALAGKLWKAPVEQAINEYSIPSLAAHTQVEVSFMNRQAELIGAAALVVENLNKINIVNPKPELSYSIKN